MALPAVQQFVSPYNPSAGGESLLANAQNNHPPVTNQNSVFSAKYGNAKWIGNCLTISKDGDKNYWFIPAVQNRVSYCVVPCNGGGGAYVISDQYGGCEYHELYNEGLNMLAFLHVYRGGGATTQYQAAGGWVRRSVKRSAGIVAARGADISGSNLSVSYINRGFVPPRVESEFVNVGNLPFGPPPGGVPRPPRLEVRTVNSGDASYNLLSLQSLPLVGSLFR